MSTAPTSRRTPRTSTGSSTATPGTTSPVWRSTGPAKAADVGTYDIVASSADNPNYAYTYETGTETITPAPLTITADDVTRRYGAAADYTASFDGLVNGDGPGSVDGLGFAGAPAGADVGDYPIALAGAANPNYDITLVDGTESVVPAPLTITADDATRRYGAASPAYTATFDGLTNGDEETDVQGLSITGASAAAGVGTYPISPPVPPTPTTTSASSTAPRPSPRLP